MEYTHQLVAIFCEIDDFCKEVETYFQHKLLTGPVYGLAVSEIMTLLILFGPAQRNP